MTRKGKVQSGVHVKYESHQMNNKIGKQDSDGVKKYINRRKLAGESTRLGSREGEERVVDQKQTACPQQIRNNERLPNA